MENNDSTAEPPGPTKPGSLEAKPPPGNQLPANASDAVTRLGPAEAWKATSERIKTWTGALVGIAFVGGLVLGESDESLRPGLVAAALVLAAYVIIEIVTFFIGQTLLHGASDPYLKIL